MTRSPAFERYAEDGALVLGGGAAILLQLGDPVVARGVAEHSAFARDPVRRLTNTLTYVYAVSLSDDVLGAMASRFVDRAHTGVPGATDAAHQLWVAATLYWAGTRVHELLYGRMPAALADEIYEASARLGTALQLPPEAWPVDRAAFESYWRGAVAELSIGDDALGVARDLLHPRVGPLWLRASMPLARLVTAGLLPASVRRAYGLPWSRARRRRCALAIRMLRDVARVLPRRLRTLPSRMLLARLTATADRMTGGGDAHA